MNHGEGLLWAEAKLEELLKELTPGKKTALPHGERKALPEGIDFHQAHKSCRWHPLGKLNKA